MLKVGDMVRVRDDLVEGKRYGEDKAVSEMIVHKGKNAIIQSIEKTKEYTMYHIDLDKGYWNWTPEMFDKKKPRNGKTSV